MGTYDPFESLLRKGELQEEDYGKSLHKQLLMLMLTLFDDNLVTPTIIPKIVQRNILRRVTLAELMIAAL